MQNQPTTSPQGSPTPSGAHARAANIRQQLDQVVKQARQDIGQVNDPKAQALFETTAETLLGLMKAYEDYEQNRPAWR